MITDSIADFLIQIKNAYRTRKQTLELPYSKMKEGLSTILHKHGYLDSFLITGDSQKILRLKLKYHGRQPVLTDVVRISKSGRRVYINRHSVPTVLGGVGIAIISTPKGLKTDSEARQERLGGEVICTVW